MDNIFHFIDVRPYIDASIREPRDLFEYLRSVSEVAGQDVVSKGKGAGSLESDETAGLDYRVTSGPQIEKHAPHLWDLYNNPDLISMVSRVTGFDCKVSRHVDSGTNINDVRTGGRYEMHIDSSPYTLLMFGSNHPKGGALQVQVDKRWHVIQPHAGLGVLFDGSVTPHRVQPTQTRRFSVPMVFVPSGFDELASRGGNLDGHMYG